MARTFTEDVIRIISNIPRGKVLSYGGIAFLAGKPGGARQVTRILHSSSKKHNLPWHRVVNSQGKISMKDPVSYAQQKALLGSEGIKFSSKDHIDFDEYFWSIQSIKDIE